MESMIVTFIITIPLLTGAALIINFCRRRVGKTRHGLTSMCHQTGGTMCNSCGSALQKNLETKDPLFSPD